MEATQIYVITWSSILAAICLSRWPQRLIKRAFGPILARLPSIVLQGFHKCLKIPQRTLYFWRCERITITHYAYLLIYILGNGLLFAKPELSNGFRITRTNSDETQKRSAIAAVTNLVLVILGGRSCVIADAFDMPLHQYYFAHRWLARLAIIEILMHVAIQTKEGITWSAHVIFGLIALILLLLILIFSVVWVRDSHKSLFIWSHLSLAVSTVVTLLLHVWLLSPQNISLEAKIPISVASVAWFATSLYRWSRSQRLEAEVEKIYDQVQATSHVARVAYTGAALIKVRLRKSILIHSGAYFYVYFHKLPIRERLHGSPLMVYNWSPLKDKAAWVSDCRRMTELTFLVQDRPYLTQLLMNGRIPVTIEGPYGRDVRLHRFDTVCLIASGIGIAGILPLALSLADRSLHDRNIKKQLGKDLKDGCKTVEPFQSHSRNIHRDRTRRLNIFWALDNNLQINWLINGLAELAKLDSKHALVDISIYEPDKRNDCDNAAAVIPESFRGHCRAKYAPHSTWAVHVKHQINWCLDTSPGEFAAAVCGTADVRQLVNEVLSRHPRQSTFFDLEHQPRRERDNSTTVGEAAKPKVDPEPPHVQELSPDIELAPLQPVQVRHRVQRINLVQSHTRQASEEGYIEFV